MGMPTETERRIRLSEQLATVLNGLLELDDQSILAVEYTRGGPQRIVVGSGSVCVWLMLGMPYGPDFAPRPRRFEVRAEPFDDCLEPYDHNGHVWTSRDGDRRCAGSVAPVGGWQSLNEKRR